MTGGRLAELLGLLVSQAKSDDERDAIFRLRDLVIRSVDVVDRGANKRRFLIVKRGDTMASNDEITFGPPVVEGPGGELSTAAAPAPAAPVPAVKADEAPALAPDAAPAAAPVAKLELSPAARTVGLKVLTEVAERCSALVVMVQDSTEAPAGGGEAEVGAEVAALCGLLEGLEEQLAPGAPAEGEAPVEGAAPKDKGKGGGACKADEAPAPAVKADEAPVDAAADAVLEQLEGLAKRGAKMAGARLEKFRSLVAELAKLADELAPGDPKAEALDRAVAELDKVNKRVAELEARLTVAPAPAPVAAIPDGQAATEAPAAPVVKRSPGRLVAGVDLNNPNNDPATADKSLTFF